MQPVNNVMTPMVNLVAFVSEPDLEGTQISGAWVRPGSASDLLSTFESGSWEDEVQALIGVSTFRLQFEVTSIESGST